MEGESHGILLLLCVIVLFRANVLCSILYVGEAAGNTMVYTQRGYVYSPVIIGKALVYE